jgi:ABC-type transport system involved in cytochrome c biogenesis permease subunit
MAVSVGWIIIIFAFHREHLHRNEHIVVATVSWISYCIAHLLEFVVKRFSPLSNQWDIFWLIVVSIVTGLYFISQAKFKSKHSCLHDHDNEFDKHIDLD